MEQSSCRHYRELPRWTQSSPNVSPYPAQAVDEDVEVDGMERLYFHFTLFVYFRPPGFSFFCAASNRFCCRSDFPFILLAFPLL
jgi:hypothetical protein